MTQTPLLAVEQALTSYGDQLYRLALLLAPDERASARLLHTTVRDLATNPPSHFDAPVVLERLAKVARLQSTPNRPTPAAGSLNHALRMLPLDQRLLLGLHLLLNYDIPLSARIAGIDPDQAHTAISTAIQSLAGPAAIRLPTATPTPECAPARQVMLHTVERGGRDATLRGHLATCSICRAFDDAWDDLVRTVERELRGSLRNRSLPAELHERLVRAARPRKEGLFNPALRLAAVPAAVILLITALVLPGLFQSRQPAIQQDAPPVDPHELVDRALNQADQPPTGSGVWHATWESLWYFDDSSYAPIRAEAWIDTVNPARHRLQVAHADGGAPYEFQIGNGRNRLYYALASNYGRSLDFGLPTPGDMPALVTLTAEPVAQAQARAERMRSGVWELGVSYLRQAAETEDLRTLGRQRNGEKVVQLISFSGTSPLAQASANSGITLPPTTVLLAIAVEDARLYSVTELTGPAGSAQTSRVTWRLQGEEWLNDEIAVNPLFDPAQAWTGLGTFSSEPDGALADPAQPLITSHEVYHPARLLLEQEQFFWLPGTPPPGVERALLRWWPATNQAALTEVRPRSLIYLGAGRRLTLNFDMDAPAGWSGDGMEIGPWRVTLRAGRGLRYQATLVVRPDFANQPWAGQRLLIDAHGFSRDEVVALIERMQMFDRASLLSHATLFALPPGIAPEAGTALLAALDQYPAPVPGEIFYRSDRVYTRHNPDPDSLSDPYHRPPYGGLPEHMVNELWYRLASDTAQSGYLYRYFTRNNELLMAYFFSPERSWFFDAAGQRLNIWPGAELTLVDRSLISPADEAMLDILAGPAAHATVEKGANGTLLLYATVPLQTTRLRFSIDRTEGWPYIDDLDLKPDDNISYEITIADKRSTGVRIYAGDPPTLLTEWTAGPTGVRPASEAPATLLSGEPPAAMLVDDATSEALPTHELVRQATLSEARQVAGTALIIPPDELLFFETAQIGGTTGAGRPFDGFEWQGVVQQGLAVQLNFRNAEEQILHSYQGPSEALGNYLRSLVNAPPWASSEQRSVTIAGRDVEGWLMFSHDRDTAWFFVELDGTLAIFEGQSDWVVETVLPMLPEFAIVR